MQAIAAVAKVKIKSFSSILIKKNEELWESCLLSQLAF
jgi:hypothetical protein